MPWDPAEAVRCFEAARRTGMIRAEAMLALLAREDGPRRLPWGTWLAELAARATAGDPAARALAARIQEQDLGVAANPTVVGPWLREATAAGDAEATYLLRRRATFAAHDPAAAPDAPTSAQGRAFLAHAAEGGYRPARQQLAFELIDGCNDWPGDPARGLAILEADAYHAPEAARALAECFEKGHGVPRDEAWAFHFHEVTASLGDPYGLVAAGEAYLAGRLVSRDPARAFAAFRRVLAEHPAESWPIRHLGSRILTTVGQAAEHGWGMAQGPALAIALYHDASPSSEAELRLGQLREAGLGAPRDLAAAAGWYMRAAQLTLLTDLPASPAEAIARLGHLDAQGIAIPGDVDALRRRLAQPG